MALKPTLNSLLKNSRYVHFDPNKYSRSFVFFQLCGKILEGEEKYADVSNAAEIDEEKSWSEHSAPKMDALMAMITSLSTNSALTEDLQKDLKMLLDTRTNEKWASAEADNAKAKEESAKLAKNPAPRKSAAIRIEVDIHMLRIVTEHFHLICIGSLSLIPTMLKRM